MQKINIGLVTDDKYIQHVGVCMFSILKNCSTPLDIYFYVFDGNINKKNKKLMKDMCNKFGAHIKFIRMSNRDWKLFQGLKFHRTPFVYCKLLFPDKLKKINKIIYLDADTLVKGDIKELNDIDLGQNIIGAVPDGDINETQKISKINLGISQKKEYFNSGVLVINCKKWRENNTLKKIIRFIKENPKKNRFQDQDALNFVLQDNWKILPYEWNLIHSFFYNSRELKKKLPNLKKIIAHPKIIHYTIKPWDYSKVHPLRKEYWNYKKQTPWRNYKYENKNLKNLLLKILRFIIRPVPWEMKITVKKLLIKQKKPKYNYIKIKNG